MFGCKNSECKLDGGMLETTFFSFCQFSIICLLVNGSLYVQNMQHVGSGVFVVPIFVCSSKTYFFPSNTLKPQQVACIVEMGSIEIGRKYIITWRCKYVETKQYFLLFAIDTCYFFFSPHSVLCLLFKTENMLALAALVQKAYYIQLP